MSNSLRILRKVRTEFDFQSFVELTFPVKYATNGEIRICCPKCGDTKFKCYVNNDKKYFNCFKCDFNSGNYDVFDFVAVGEGITRAQAMLRLAREYADVAKSWEEIVDSAGVLEVEEDEAGEPSTVKTIESLPEGVVQLSLEKPEEQKPFWDYLSSRGLTDKEILDISTHCVPDERVYLYDTNSRLRGNIGHRIVFPVYGKGNKLVSWLARSIDGAEPKYFNAPESEINRTLWPFAPCKGHLAVLVEGVLDALAVRRVGFGAYATFGKKISYDQVSLLKDWGITSIVLFWDKKDSKKEMIRAIESLKLHFKEVLVPDFTIWPKDRDSGDTLSWEPGAALLKDMLTNHLLDVNSLEFSTWQLH
jgi:DNA primase